MGPHVNLIGIGCLSHSGTRRNVMLVPWLSIARSRRMDLVGHDERRPAKTRTVSAPASGRSPSRLTALLRNHRDPLSPWLIVILREVLQHEWMLICQSVKKSERVDEILESNLLEVTRKKRKKNFELRLIT